MASVSCCFVLGLAFTESMRLVRISFEAPPTHLKILVFSLRIVGSPTLYSRLLKRGMVPSILFINVKIQAFRQEPV